MERAAAKIASGLFALGMVKKGGKRANQNWSVEGRLDRTTQFYAKYHFPPMFSTRIFLFITFLTYQMPQLILAQDFKSTFVQDDFLPIPLAAPLADSVDGELKQDPRCLEQNEIGNGTGEIIRYFYNSANSSCSSFLYSGEGGNQNNFLTEIDCLNNCYIDVNEGAPLKEEDVHMINQEADLGPKQGCLLAKDGGGEGGKKNCTELETSVLENQHFMA